MGAPDGGDLVHGRHQAVGVVRHVGDGEVVAQEGLKQTGEGYSQEGELSPHQGPGHGHPGLPAVEGARKREDALDDGQGKGQDQRKVPELRDHRPSAFLDTPSAWAVCRLSATSGGM